MVEMQGYVREQEILCPQPRQMSVGGETLIVRPLVLGDYKQVGDRVADAYRRLAAQVDLSDVSVPQLAALVLAELPELLALALRRQGAEGPEPVEAEWLERNLSAGALLAVIEAVLEVNDLEGILKKFERLRRRAQAVSAGA